MIGSKNEILCVVIMQQRYEEIRYPDTEDDDDEILEAPSSPDAFIQAAGGWTTRGHIYGLGESSQSYYEKTDNHSSCTQKRSRELESEVERLNKELEEERVERQKQKEKIEAMERELQKVHGMQRQLETLTQWMSGCNPRQDFWSHGRFPPSPPPPPPAPQPQPAV